MKILLCHNHYQTRAGEDHVFAAEMQLLQDHGHQVITYTRDNTEIQSLSFLCKMQVFLYGFYSPRTARDIREIVTREQPDVAHIHNVFPLISPSIYCALKQLHVPVVQTIHNFRFFCSNGLLFYKETPCSPFEYHFLRCLIRRCYRNSALYSAWYAAILMWHRFRKTFHRCISLLIVLNTYTRDIFVKNGFDASILTVKPNAAVPVPVTADTSYDYAVFIGRFSREKGIITLLKAAKQVPGLKIRIIGAGPLEQYVKDCAASGSCPGIDLHGYLPFSECCRQMAGALVTVFPSECYENCPLTVINSLWYGTPVIASRIGGIPDFVPEDIGGWLFEPGNADALAAKLQWFMENRDAVVAQRVKTRQWARERFSPEINYTRLLKIYRDALHKPC